MLPPEPIRQAIEQRLWPEVEPAAADWCPTCGGLSNASVWRVDSGGSVFAVRRWWTGIDPRLLAWMAESLRTLVGSPLDFVAAPLGGMGDDAWPYLDAHEGRWEAAPWKPGEPLRADGPRSDLVAAIDGLVRFHRRMQEVPPCPVPSLASLDVRVSRLTQWLAQPPFKLPLSLSQRWPELAQLLPQLPLAAAEAARQLARVSAASLGTPQPIHGDARPEHFLLRDSQLTGLIDFGAMRSDSALIDVARLAGELAGGDAARLAEVVSLYEARAGTPIDRSAVRALDASGAVLSAINWMRWLSDPAGPERDPASVRDRLRTISARLPTP